MKLFDIPRGPFQRIKSYPIKFPAFTHQTIIPYHFLQILKTLTVNTFSWRCSGSSKYTKHYVNRSLPTPHWFFFPSRNLLDCVTMVSTRYIQKEIFISAFLSTSPSNSHLFYRSLRGNVIKPPENIKRV